MTDLEKEMMKHLIIGHRLCIGAEFCLDRIIEKHKCSLKDFKKAKEVLDNAPIITQPIVELIGQENLVECANMIYDFKVSEEKIIEFVEDCINKQSLKE